MLNHTVKQSWEIVAEYFKSNNIKLTERPIHSIFEQYGEYQNIVKEDQVCLHHIFHHSQWFTIMDFEKIRNYLADGNSSV
jgi:hypothetical protein